MTRAAHFGAGNIGRGFIADLLHRSGYAVTFLDVDPHLVHALHTTGQVDLHLIDHPGEQHVIDGLDAINSANDLDAAVQALVAADIITTSVWANNLPRIAPLLADGLIARNAQGRPKVNILACENAMFASSTLRQAVLDAGRGIEAADLDSWAAFPNTAVDRVVLPVESSSGLGVAVADYFELAVEQPALVDPAHLPLQGATYTDDLGRYLVRKLYVVNCGHLWAGLLAHRHGLDSVRDVFVSPELVAPVREAMAQSAAFVGRRHGFDPQTMADYVELSVTRYQAPGVDYSAQMVTRSPIRKLAADDRFVGPAAGCEQEGLNNDRLVEGIAMLLLLDRPDDAESVTLQQYIASHGVPAALEHYTGIPRGSRTHDAVLAHHDRLSAQAPSPLGHGLTGVGRN